MRTTDLKVSDLMTTAVTAARASSPLDRAHADMRLLDVRHLPVVDDGSHVVGMLSNRDVLPALRSRNKVRVADVMSRHVVTIRPEAPAHHATALMLKHKIGALPVVGESEQLVGVITETDLLQVAHSALGGTAEDAQRLPVF